MLRVLRRLDRVGRPTALVLVVDLDDLLTGCLVAGLWFRGGLVFRCLSLAATHASTVHRTGHAIAFRVV
jgi:hypothetical protein